jgi:hypothetical protein
MKISLEYIAKTENIFSSRGERELMATNTLVEKFKGHSDSSFYLVISTEISKQILVSKSFISYDYFSAGIEKLINNKKQSFVGEFFRYGLIFQEGEEHLAQRRFLFKMLDELNSQLIQEQHNLHKFITARISKIKTPLDFSKNVTIFCLSFMIKKLLNISNQKAIKSILLRSNIWRSYFDKKKHLGLEKSLLILSSKFISELDNEDDRLKLLLAQSLVIMGYDPLVATICASASKKDLSITFAQDALQVCPTSYVTRICIENVLIKDILFTKGSIVTLSLLPTKSEKNNINENSYSTKSLSFGLGNHMCIGKKNSLLILNMAENVWADIKRNIPNPNLTISPDGAFLAYKNL